MASETSFNSGNSYGPQTAQVQFSTGPSAGAVGTIVVPAGKRVNTIDIKVLEGVTNTIKVQETDTNPNGADGAPSWSDVSGATATIVAGGTARISCAGLVKYKYVRLYATPASAATSICRATINDLEMLNNFRQNVPYGVG